MAIYAREMVKHAWLIDPLLRTLEAYKFDRGRWLAIATHQGDVVVRVEPFEAIEIELALLWEL